MPPLHPAEPVNIVACKLVRKLINTSVTVTLKCKKDCF